jgi:hypothetical protein
MRQADSISVLLGILVIAAAVTHHSGVHEHPGCERLLMFGSSMQQHAAACEQKHAAGVVAIAAAGTADRTGRIAEVGCSVQEAASSSWHAVC